jgi:ABC-type glutathione transport system ATPase component
MSPHLVVDLSSHGFGHAGMTIPLLNALDRAVPGMRLTLRTAVPRAWLADRLESPFDYLPEADFGMVMAGAMRVLPEESAAAYRRVHADWTDRVAAAAERLLARFELPADRRPSASLSVGNRQRLDLALAVLGDPNVLLLDEPTAALDPRQRRRLWETAGAIKDGGGAVVLVTQNLEDLERVADRVAVLFDGRLVFDGSVDDYLASEAADVFA